MPHPKNPILEELRVGIETADDGPVAVGGTLAPDILEKAYRMGIFPWSSHPAVT